MMPGIHQPKHHPRRAAPRSYWLRAISSHHRGRRLLLMSSRRSTIALMTSTKTTALSTLRRRFLCHSFASKAVSWMTHGTSMPLIILFQQSCPLLGHSQQSSNLRRLPRIRSSMSSSLRHAKFLPGSRQRNSMLPGQSSRIRLCSTSCDHIPSSSSNSNNKRRATWFKQATFLLICGHRPRHQLNHSQATTGSRIRMASVGDFSSLFEQLLLLQNQILLSNISYRSGLARHLDELASAELRAWAFWKHDKVCCAENPLISNRLPICRGTMQMFGRSSCVLRDSAMNMNQQLRSASMPTTHSLGWKLSLPKSNGPSCE